ncbi:MAG: hypothetical protein K6C95_04970 [Lachnospiraceae bacterium]|nr:hypothetical protein [Lachnospiraceae bacterium]
MYLNRMGGGIIIISFSEFFKEGVALLKKANIDVSEDDIKKIQASVADGKLDLGDIKDLAGGLFKK